MYVCGAAANKLLRKNQEDVFWLMHKEMNKKNNEPWTRLLPHHKDQFSIRVSRHGKMQIAQISGICVLARY